LPKRSNRTIILVMQTVSLAAAKAHLSSYVDEVLTTRERVTITRNGVPASVLMSVDDLESLEETLALLSDEDAMRQIRQAQSELDEGLGQEWTDYAAAVAA